MPRGKGEGSVYQRGNNGLWVGTIELPPGPDGKRRRRQFTSKSKTTVIRKLAEARKQLEAHGDIPSDNLTVEGWVDYWLREVVVRTRRPKTVEAYRSNVAWVNRAIGTQKLSRVTPATVRRVFALMEAEGKSSTYQRNVHSVMSALFKDAEREGRINRSPVELVQAPRKAVANLDALTPDEAAALIREFIGDEEAYLWATFLLTGARRGEVIGLEWDRVTDVLDLSWQLQRLPDGPRPADFEYRPLGGGLYLTRPKTRTGWRIIPLVDPLKGILETWRDVAPVNEWGLVFTRQTQKHGRVPWDPDQATKAWNTARAAAGVRDTIRLHDLRHTTAALLYALNVPEDVIEAILGHSTAAMSRHYRGRVDRARLESAMVQLSASLDR